MECIYKDFDLGRLQKEITPPSFDGVRKNLLSPEKKCVYDSGNSVIRLSNCNSGSESKYVDLG